MKGYKISLCAICIVAVVLFVMHLTPRSGSENEQLGRSVNDLFAQVVVDCHNGHVGMTTLFAATGSYFDLPESIQPILDLGPRAVPYLERLRNASFSKHQEPEYSIASRAISLIKAKRIKKQFSYRLNGVVVMEYHEVEGDEYGDPKAQRQP
jgi:hypothetical protein